MKFLQKLKQRFEENKVATEMSIDKLAEAHRTDPIVDRKHEEALQKLQEADALAQRLKQQDRENHYSEGLSVAFRKGRTA